MSLKSTSTSSSKIDSSLMSQSQAHRYSSPPPDTRMSGRSPPPPPRYGNNSRSRIEPAADAVLFEINSGRSILNPKPVGIESIDMSRHALYKDFGVESASYNSASGGLLLASPSYPHLPSPSSPDDVTTEEINADMPPMPSPIIKLLPMRSIRMRSPIAPRVYGRIPEHYSFVPIHHEEESQS